MDSEKPQLARGLRDVIAGQTSICLLDEPNQRLYYRGYAIEDLVGHSTFEEVCYLLLFEELPTAGERSHFIADLVESVSTIRKEVFDTSREFGETRKISLSHRAHPMDRLKLMVCADGVEGAVRLNNSLGEDRELAKDLIARMMVYAAFIGGAEWGTHEFIGGTPIRNFVRTLEIQDNDGFAAQLFSTAFILYAEHEFNASTFAVRVAASAHSDIYSAIVAGIGVLRGSRHGGANEEAMKMMLEIGEPENARAWCDRFFETPGARLPGFGHAVYTRSDPRVAILKPKVRELSERKSDTRWYEIGAALEEYMAERAVHKGRGIPANVDLWTAPLYYLLDIPIPMYTPLFAAARVAGWCAHYLEVRYENNEPITRPRAEYIGPAPRPFVRSQDQK